VSRFSLGGRSVARPRRRRRSLDPGRVLSDDTGRWSRLGRRRVAVRVSRAGRVERAVDDRRHQPRHSRHQHL